jgi:uncharacterized protein
VNVLYVDTSALAKLYLIEAGSERMTARTRAASSVASSTLAWPECLASFARRRREGTISPDEHAELREKFIADWGNVATIDLDGRVLEIADRLLLTHALRGADAAHLASALYLAEQGLAVEFACSDRTLISAARAERLTAFDPAT